MKRAQVEITVPLLLLHVHGAVAPKVLDMGTVR